MFVDQSPTPPTVLSVGTTLPIPELTKHPNSLQLGLWHSGRVLPSMNQDLIVSPVLQEREGAGEMGLEVKSAGWSSEDLS